MGALAGNRQLGDIERLGVGASHDRPREQLAELGAVDGVRREDRLVQVLPRPRNVVVGGEHIHLGRCAATHQRGDQEPAKSGDSVRTAELPKTAGEPADFTNACAAASMHSHPNPHSAQSHF